MFKIHYPERGRKPSIMFCLSVSPSCSKSITPKGDGNASCTSREAERNSRSKSITPKGDGNDHLPGSFPSLFQRSKSITSKRGTETLVCNKVRNNSLQRVQNPLPLNIQGDYPFRPLYTCSKASHLLRANRFRTRSVTLFTPSACSKAPISLR